MGFYDTIRMGSAAAAGAASYSVDRSLRFNDDDSAYLNRQYAQEPTSQYKMTFSCWVKRCSSDSGVQTVIGVQDNWETPISFSNDSFRAVGPNTSATYITTAKYRDFSAWMHVMTVYDTQNSTGADRMICYINGERLTDFSTTGTVTLNQTTVRALRDGYNTYIAKDGVGAYGDMYCAEVNVIDGQALTPSDFTETNSTTGQLIPKEYTGSYGTNGFYLNFSDNSGTTATTLGKDSSGNGNNFTPNNFSVAAGQGNDSVSDSPTNNFSTINPLVGRGGNYLTYANGNLDFTISPASTYPKPASSFQIPTSGKWYCEWVFTTVATGVVGVGNVNTAENGGTDQLNGINYLYTGEIRINDSTSQGSLTALSDNDIVGVKVDSDAGTVAFTINGSAAGNAENISSMATPTDLVFWAYRNAGGGTDPVGFVNFGQKPFSYQPTGFKSLCSANLPDPTILLPNKHFGTQLWSGYTADGRQIANLEFQPDLVWWKTRNNTNAQYIVDSVRGVDKQLRPEGTMAETNYSERLESFISGGFTVGTDGDVQHASNSYVAWNWKGGGSASSNSDGDITSQLSANPSAGFSIVGYTGNGTNDTDITIGHGLGVTPDVVILKARGATTASQWIVWHKDLSAHGSYTTNLIFLQTTSAQNYYSDQFKSAQSTTFTIRTEEANNGRVNKNGTDYIAYCFSGVEGYSKFGKYTGNGNADGTFVFTGFSVAWLLIKRIDSSTHWIIKDTARDTFNVANKTLLANSDTSEDTSGSFSIDFLSNGFKCRASGTHVNANSGTYIYLAFAESPFKNSRAR